MRVSENLLPGKENALSAEYLVVKCHFSSVRMLQKQIEAERKAGKATLSNTTPPGGYYLPAAGDTMEIRKFIRTLRIEERILCGLWRVQENFWKSWKVIRIDF